MFLKIPFFGLISKRSPMTELVTHYELIAKGMALIEESLECYIGGEGACKEFRQLVKEVDKLEDQADKVKRSIRNHLPKSLLMPVDKTVFFNYTRSQDNILDDGQDAMQWLGMRGVKIGEQFQKELLALVAEVLKTVDGLKPALQSTIGLIHGDHYDRQETKTLIREARRQHKQVRSTYNKAIAEIYNSDMDFKDIHQLIHFCQSLFSMSHNTEGCADLLRAMMAR